MKITEIEISKLKAYKHNPRKNDAAVDKVAESIKAFGFKVPVVVDTDMEIVAGHTRVKAAGKLGMDKVPCIVADDLTPDEVKAFRLADNRTSDFAEWDIEYLESELGEIELDLEWLELDSLLDIPVDEFDGDGDGGGSQISQGSKVRIVIGSLMFDIDDPDHSIYKATKDIDEDDARESVLEMIESWR
jgi:hypothetical protein